MGIQMKYTDPDGDMIQLKCAHVSPSPLSFPFFLY